MKLNTDGCMEQETKLARARGVLRNDEGSWVQGYSLNLVCCWIEEAELWALIHRMRMAWETGFKRIQMETDSLTMAKWLRGLEEVNTLLAHLMHECKE